MTTKTTALQMQLARLPATTASRITRIAEAVLERGKYSWIWVIPTCPYCGKRHDHYGGALDGNPQMHLGLAFPAHCANLDRQRLVLGDPDTPLLYVLSDAHPT